MIINIYIYIYIYIVWFVSKLFLVTFLNELQQIYLIAQSAAAVEYTDCTSAEG